MGRAGYNGIYSYAIELKNLDLCNSTQDEMDAGIVPMDRRSEGMAGGMGVAYEKAMADSKHFIPHGPGIATRLKLK